GRSAGQSDRDWEQRGKENRFEAETEILVSLTRALFEPLSKSRSASEKKEIVFISDARAAPREMTNQLFVIEQDIAIVIAGVQKSLAAESAPPRLIGRTLPR